MKAFLLYKGQDFDLKGPLPPNEADLTQDLDLDTLFYTMAADDPTVMEVTRKAVLSGTDDLETILYRQQALQDCLKSPSVVRDLYRISSEAIEREKRIYHGIFSAYPEAVLHRSMQVLQGLVESLRQLKRVADDHGDAFRSEAFTTLFAMLRKELDDAYFRQIEMHLHELEFRDGVLISASLGLGNKGAQYTLRQFPDRRKGWMRRISEKSPPTYTVTISDRDESGAQALSELRDRGIVLVANIVAQSTDHILSFFKMLQAELAFYIGCLNLHERLLQKGEAVAFPVPLNHRPHRWTFRGLYDVSLALRAETRVVGNDMEADGRGLIIITGANQGGKSTFLRSVGLAQLMMQCGMFVAADAFQASVCDGVFTHYKREEDVTLRSGKLDEELRRMSRIVDHLNSRSLLLLNESFAATNEREGSEIAGQIIRALVEKGVMVFFVTHLYEFAHTWHEQAANEVLFLRAVRESDGSRTFRVREGEPLQTSYGQDLYERIFGAGS